MVDTSKYKMLYLQEAGGHVSGIDEGLLALEKNPEDEKTVERLFRHYHTIKGMSASMGYVPIQKLAHAEENLLDKVRSKELGVSTPLISLLFECLDKIRDLLRQVEEDEELDTEISSWLERLEAAATGALQEESAGSAGAEQNRPAAERPPKTEEGAGGAPTATTGQSEPVLRLSGTMKVDGRVFDDLLTIVGDLFMEMTSFRAFAHMVRSVKFKDALFRLGKDINRLHTSILSARMLPIEDLTGGLPRIVRDVSLRSGKEVDLFVEGTGISLDRAILENLSGPLVHMIRNAVDHGIETPEERRAAGKPLKGSVKVRAYARKDRVAVEVADDGRGIDIERLKEKAVSRGVPKERIEAMTDKEAFMLVTTPGLSTAEEVSETSGRGVGMDVVKSAIEGMGGEMEIESRKGAGTTIRMELPRTTSITKALVVEMNRDIFLLPISMIEKVVEASADQVAGGIFRYGEADIPVIPLASALGIEGADRAGNCTIVVVEDPRSQEAEVQGPGPRTFIGLKVDDFGDEIDAYIKPLQPPMGQVRGVSGITITGDGKPVFLLDLPYIIRRAIPTACIETADN